MRPAFDPLAALSQQERDVFRQFKARIVRDDCPDPVFCTDLTLVRYLRARDFDLDKSEALLRGTMRWREETRPDEIDPRELTKEAQYPKCYLSDLRDKTGRPVIYMKPRFDFTNNYKDGLRMLIYDLERAVEKLDEEHGVFQMVWIMDFKDFSMRNSPPLNVSLETLRLIGDHYPERLGLAFMVDPPFYFTIFWAAVSPFVPAATSRKIRWLKGDLEAKRKFMAEYFEPNQLEKDFGGTVEFSYDHGKFWGGEMALYEERMASIYARNPHRKPKPKKDEVQVVTDASLAPSAASGAGAGANGIDRRRSAPGAPSST